VVIHASRIWDGVGAGIAVDQADAEWFLELLIRNMTKIAGFDDDKNSAAILFL